MSKRIRDAFQQQGIAAKKPKRSLAPSGRVLTAEEDDEDSTAYRMAPSTAPSAADAVGACSTSTTASGRDNLAASMATTSSADSSSIRWRRLVWLCGMGLEDLVLGWFPFSEEDFAGQTCWDEDEEGHGHLFDDIWQIKHIQEIPKTNTTASPTTI